MGRISRLVFGAIITAFFCCSAQQQLQQQQPQQLQQPGAAQTAQPAVEVLPLRPPAIRPNYVLSGADQIMIRVPQAEEINGKPFRIETDGTISLPLVGILQAAGRTIEQFEADLTTALSKYVVNPLVSITVVQFHSDPVFFSGAFQKPGIYGLQASQTSLVDMLSVVGGLQANSSRRIRITRRLDQGPIPLPTAVEDPDKKVSTVEVSLNRLMETNSPAENITLQPYDVVRAFRAEMVYLNIQGGKGGAYALEDRDALSIVQLISLAGGLPGGIDGAHAKVLRPILDSNKRAEITLDVTRIVQGSANDFPLMPNDVLYIPKSKSNLGFLKPMVYIIPSLVTGLIYGVVRH